ncbi:MAG: outer membrane beta-barrel protein [Pseudomonadaceae bacterium]|nr:outer membrane beta-barrel protein [Pseudomonadaceae bacterium]
MKKLLLTALLLAYGTSAWAEAGDFLVRVGASIVDPKSDNHPVVEVDSGSTLTFNGTYFMTDQWAVELLAALPFKHDIDAVGGGNIGETKHLPPTLSVQYHFMPDQPVRPYVGAGLNYTIFFEEDLDGADLSLDNSLGWAAQIGVDIDLTESMFLNADVRYIDIEADAKVNSTSIGTVEIDPWVYGIHVGFRF